MATCSFDVSWWTCWFNMIWNFRRKTFFATMCWLVPGPVTRNMHEKFWSTHKNKTWSSESLVRQLITSLTQARKRRMSPPEAQTRHKSWITNQHIVGWKVLPAKNFELWARDTAQKVKFILSAMQSWHNYSVVIAAHPQSSMSPGSWHNGVRADVNAERSHSIADDHGRLTSKGPTVRKRA